MSLKKEKCQGKAGQVTVNKKEENTFYFCLDFVQEFGLRKEYDRIVLFTIIFFIKLNFCFRR